MAQVGITRCKPEMKDYCFHGQCVYVVDLNEHYCRYGEGMMRSADLPEVGLEVNCMGPFISLLLALSWSTHPAKYSDAYKTLKRSNISIKHLSYI